MRDDFNLIIRHGKQRIERAFQILKKIGHKGLALTVYVHPEHDYY